MQKFFITLIVFLALPAALHAQNAAPITTPANNDLSHFEQFPSYIEVNTTVQGGTEVALRCGYVQTGTTISADPSYMEMAFMNASTGNYLRAQRIDNNIIVTSPIQGTPGRFALQLLEANGTMITKTCLFNPATDTVQSCVAAAPLMTPAQMTNQDQTSATQCGNFLEKASAQLDRVTYNAQKTVAFKNGLRQKVNILAGP